MASTYSSQLRLELMANGENSGTWGTKTNTTLDLIEDAIAGMATVAVTGGAYSLTSNNAAADEARCLALKFTGTLTSTSTITVPSVAKMYVVWNATSGAYTLSLKTSGGGATAVTQGAKVILWCDGTTIYDLTTVSGAPGSFTTLAASSTTTLSALLDLSGASAGQIKFPASQNASSDANTLDDYEEGTWTPGYSSSTGSFTTLTYSALRLGVYVKIGKMVTVSFTLATDEVVLGTAGGNLQMTGLPFTVASSNAPSGVVFCQTSNWGGTNSAHNGTCNASQTYLSLAEQNATTGESNTLTPSRMTTGASATQNIIKGNFSYFI